VTALRATADVQRFDEAVNWFQRRIPVTRAMRDQMQEWAGTRVWWVSGTQHLDVVVTTHAIIANAIEKGTPPHLLVKELKHVLPQLSDSRLATVARTNLHSAFNAGRWQQLNDPDIRELRPFWQFDATDDFRTTDGCRALDGTALPNDDPFWLTNWPPRHFQCRSQVRAIRRKVYERLPPEKKRLPDDYEKAGKGFGLPPDLEVPWRPDLSKVPAEVRSIFEAKAKRASDAAEAASEAERKKRVTHTPEHWLPEYEQQYGPEAGLAVARGRAALEAGLDEPASSVLDEFERLSAAGVPGFDARDLEAVRGYIGKRGTGDVRSALEGMPPGKRQAVEAAAAIAGHSLALDRGPARRIERRIAVMHPESRPTAERYARAAERFFSELSGRTVRFPSGWKFDYGFVQRSHCAVGAQEIRSAPMKPTDFIHEICHALDALNPSLARRAVEFLARRTAGELAIWLGHLTGDPRYSERETAKPDRFFTPYLGRQYPDGSTEITAILAESVAKSFWRLYAEDPEAFLFILGQLQAA
jgi:SPP1 gp7 family putative phage head morphogenesis protein